MTKTIFEAALVEVFAKLVETRPHDPPGQLADTALVYTDALVERYEARSKGKTPVKRGEKFVPPTVEEVLRFCETNGHIVNAETFVNFYASKGWRVGKEGMKDWQAAVRNWAKNNERTNGNGGVVQGGRATTNERRIAGTIDAAADFLADDEATVRRVDARIGRSQANDGVLEVPTAGVVRRLEQISVEGAESGRAGNGAVERSIPGHQGCGEGVRPPLPGQAVLPLGG